MNNAINETRIQYLRKNDLLSSIIHLQKWRAYKQAFDVHPRIVPRSPPQEVPIRHVASDQRNRQNHMKHRYQGKANDMGNSNIFFKK